MTKLLFVQIAVLILFSHLIIKLLIDTSDNVTHINISEEIDFKFVR